MPQWFASFDNTYARELEGFYTPWQPAPAREPKLIYVNQSLARELGIDLTVLGEAASKVFAGNTVPEGAEPIAQAYAGHQFGGFSPRLGDGRAVLLGEVLDRHGRRRDIALKGSGRTPYARNGDGKAAIGPMLREVLLGEAMHALGIPTTRALAVASTGEPVMREEALPGAVLTRVAASHIRVGTFEYFAARQEHDNLRRLADYTIRRHDPALAERPDRHAAFLEAVVERQASLIARWMNVGFIHGVMNTDNMALSGETIDFGPCAFLEAYDPTTVFSSIDTGGRYAYGNQPSIGQWNLTRLAEALLPLLDADVDKAVASATDILNIYPDRYFRHLLQGQRAKLGLQRANETEAEADSALAADWLSLLQAHKVDFTLGWRRLADAAAGEVGKLRSLFDEQAAPDMWLARWQARCADEDCASGLEPRAALAGRAARIRAASPFVIARNHRVEEALAAASVDGNLGPFERLLGALQQPFNESPELAPYAEPAPPAVTACYKTFCGT